MIASVISCCSIRCHGCQPATGRWTQHLGAVPWRRQHHRKTAGSWRLEPASAAYRHTRSTLTRCTEGSVICSGSGNTSKCAQFWRARWWFKASRAAHHAKHDRGLPGQQAACRQGGSGRDKAMQRPSLPAWSFALRPPATSRPPPPLPGCTHPCRPTTRPCLSA